ncbi:MAG: hypothetical protein Q9160_009073 [Pyrenula sp. 1 TL-2023]
MAACMKICEDVFLDLAKAETPLTLPDDFEIRTLLWDIESSSTERIVNSLCIAAKYATCLEITDLEQVWNAARRGIRTGNPILVRFHTFELLKKICLRPTLGSSRVLELVEEFGDPKEEAFRIQLTPFHSEELGSLEDEQCSRLSLLPLLQRLFCILFLETTPASGSRKGQSEENFHALCEYAMNYITMFNGDFDILELESIANSAVEITKRSKSLSQLEDMIRFLDNLYPRSLNSPAILLTILLASSTIINLYHELEELVIYTVRRLVQKHSAEVEKHLLAIMSDNVDNVDHDRVIGAIELYHQLLVKHDTPLSHSLSLLKVGAMVNLVVNQRQEALINRKLLQLCTVTLDSKHFQQNRSENWSDWVRTVKGLIERCQSETLSSKDKQNTQDEVLDNTLRIHRGEKYSRAAPESNVVATSSMSLNLVLDLYVSLDKVWDGVDEANQKCFLTMFTVLDYRLFSPSFCRKLVQAFLRSCNDSSDIALAALEKLTDITMSSFCEPETRLVALHLLLRIRCDSDSALWILHAAESEALAAVLGRTIASAEALRHKQDRARELSSPESAFSMPTKTSLPPLWMCGSLQGLPEKPPMEPSQVIFSFNGNSSPGVEAFRANIWLENVIELLQNEPSWEIYSYIVVHLGAQLMNVTLFEAAVPQIRLLRSILVDQIINSTYHEPPNASGLKKSDVANCIFNILTSLIAYHRVFEGREKEDLINCFNSGIGSLEGTSKGCLQALSICCVEMPRSVTSQLNAILDTISKIVTQSALAMHVLEFLVNLARLSDIYYNFAEEDIRKLFGICFKYLEIAREDKDHSQPATRPRSTGPPSSLARTPVSEGGRPVSERSAEPTNEFPQYILAMTYHVMIHWYLAINVVDRSRHSSFIIRRLMHKDVAGHSIFEEQTRVFIDMMQRTCGSDLGETDYPQDFFDESDGAIASAGWMVGTCLVVIETGSHSGRSIITKRFPTSTSHMIFAPNPQQLPRHHIPMRAPVLPASAEPESQSRVTAIHTFLLSSTLNSPVPGVPLSAQPMKLELKDERVKRAISTFDLHNTVDGHRVGVLYIRPETKTETEILSNSMVSKEFLSFMDGLGTLCPFEGTYFKTQGGYDETIDGVATYAWRDRISEMIFHVPSMMPTNLEADPGCNNKKRHVGNDHIKVFFNESGRELPLDIIDSQFKSVTIIVSPATRLSNTFLKGRELIDHAAYVPSALNDNNSQKSAIGSIETGETSDKAACTDMFKVRTLTAPHLATLSPFSSPKVVSAEALPGLIRFTALNASLYSTVAQHVKDNPSPAEPYPSPWRERYRGLVNLRNRVSKSLTEASKPPDPPKSPPRRSLGALWRSNTRNAQKDGGIPRVDRKTWWLEGKNPRPRPEVDHEVATPGPSETTLDWVDFGNYTSD